MAKTLDMARVKWERKTANAGSNWKRGVQGQGGAFQRGLAEFLGATPRADIVSSWESGVGAVSAEDFQRSISGKGGKYAENLRRALT